MTPRSPTLDLALLPYAIAGADIRVENWRVDLDDETERADVTVTMPAVVDSITMDLSVTP